MSARHKWADVAIAFAEGKTIQFDLGGGWIDYEYLFFPSFTQGEWRIKPNEPVVRYKWAYRPANGVDWMETFTFLSEEEAKDYIDPTFEKFKLEYTRTEFPQES